MGISSRKRLTVGLAIGLLVLVLGSYAGTAWAQSPVRIKTMSVSFWPEYDQPGVLVIYRGALADDVTLPVTLQFLIPKAAGKPSSTAGVDATGQFRYRSYSLADAGDFLQVSYTNPYREFQMEYYYNPLSMDGTLRSFSYQFQADYPVDNLMVEVKEPAGAQNLALSPAASETGTDFDKLPLQKYAVGALGLGETFQLNATYDKTDPRLTSEILGLAAPGTAEFEDVAKQGGTQNAVAYILIGAAATLLIGGLVYGIVQSRNRPRARPAQPARAKPPKPKKSRREKSAGGFCHQCGNRLSADAQFCPKCGGKVKDR